jgi:uroporphyrinogen decarboxylase
MTIRQRVTMAISHQQPDSVPFNIEFTQKAKARMAEYYGDPNFEELLPNCFQLVNFDGFDMCREVRPNIYEDWFGVLWDRSIDKDIGAVCNGLVSEPNMATFSFPDPDSDLLFAGKDRIIASAGDRMIVGNLGFSLFERAWTLMGMENLLVSMAINKPFVNDFLDRIVDYDLHVLRNACSFRLDCIRFGDDWGQQRGLIMGVPLWKEFIEPRIRRMYQFVHSRGMAVMIHCCGQVQEILPDLIHCGVDIFNPFQPEVMDVFEMKRKHGDKLTFYGGISIQKTLPFGSIQQVRNEVNQLMEVIGRGGGYVAAPSHAIPADAKTENVAAMIDVLRNQRFEG